MSKIPLEIALGAVVFVLVVACIALAVMIVMFVIKFIKGDFPYE